MAINKTKVREWLRDSDGYAILDPRFFLEMGVEPKKVEARTKTVSDDPRLGKYAATRSDGQPGPVRGVSEFVMIRHVAHEVGVIASEVPSFYGRGKEYRAWKSAVLKAL